MSSDVPFGSPPTPYERFMWRNRQPGAWRPVFFTFLVGLRGEVDRRLLDAALNDTLAWHPLLRAAIAGRGRRARWAPGTAEPLRVEWPPGGTRSPVEPPDVTAGPCIRVVGGQRPGGVELAVHIHHSCCDGVGTLEFLGDLFASYSQLVSGRRRAEPVRELDRAALRERTAIERMPPVHKVLARFARALAFRSSVLAGRRGSGRDAAAVFGMPEVRLDAEETAALRRLARASGATLNDLLIAEVMLAVARHNAGKGNRIRILMPMNVRTAAHAAAPAANIVGYEPIDRVVRGPEGLVASVRDQTAAIKEERRQTWLDELLVVLASRPLVLDLVLRTPLAYYTGIVSNLGDPSRSSWAHLAQADGLVPAGEAVVDELRFAPPVQARSCLSLGVTTYGGELSITGKACPLTIGAPALERFLSALGEQLRARVRDERPAAVQA